MRIKSVVPAADYQLLVESDCGQKGLFNVTPYLSGDAFKPLQDINEFKQVRSGHYFIEWTCGADLSADTIEACWLRTN
jgi:Protein of unknown function (DUF2442)